MILVCVYLHQYTRAINCASFSIPTLFIGHIYAHNNNNNYETLFNLRVCKIVQDFIYYESINKLNE